MSRYGTESDRIEFEIAENGEILTITPGISSVNHQSADQMLQDIQRTAGGEVATTPIDERHAHHHHDHHHDHHHHVKVGR